MMKKKVSLFVCRRVRTLFRLPQVKAFHKVGLRVNLLSELPLLTGKEVGKVVRTFPMFIYVAPRLQVPLTIFLYSRLNS